MPNDILQHDDDANELARVAPAVPVQPTGTTAQTANGLSRHTPGPWTHHRGGSVRVCDGRHQSVEGCRSLAEAEIIGVPRPEAVANARLISAAPDLLLSVKEFVALYVGTRDMLGPSVQAKLARAEAAIQKAGAQ